MIHGRKLILALDGVAVAAARSCELDVEQNLIQVCSPVSGKWNDYVAGTASWSASVGVLVTDNYKLLMDGVRMGKRFNMSVIDVDTQLHYYGECMLDSAKLTGTYGNLCQGSVSLKGCGELRNYMSVVTLGELRAVGAHDALITWADGDWELEQNQTGSVVVDITDLMVQNRGVMIHNKSDEYPILVMNVYPGVDASMISQVLEAGNRETIEDGVCLVIAPSVTADHKSNINGYKHYIIVDGDYKDEWLDNIVLKTL